MAEAVKKAKSAKKSVEDRKAVTPEHASGDGGIFKDPQPLSPERHGELRIRKVANAFGFVRSQHLIPVTAHEIP